MRALEHDRPIATRALATMPVGRWRFLHPSTIPYRTAMRARALQAALPFLAAGLAAAAASALLPPFPSGLAFGFCLVSAGLAAHRRLVRDADEASRMATREAWQMAHRVPDTISFNDRELSRRLSYMLGASGSVVAPIQLRLILRLVEIERVDAGVPGRVGQDGHAEPREARLAAIRTALADAEAEADAVRRSALDDIAASFARAGSILAPPAPPPAPTGSARTERLVANAEAALAIDPDLVDAGGARIDALVREHLPRLLARHAELARCAPLDGIDDADRHLEEGVELVRASVAEATAGLRHERADAIRTEIAFLRMRRGMREDDR